MVANFVIGGCGGKNCIPIVTSEVYPAGRSASTGRERCQHTLIERELARAAFSALLLLEQESWGLSGTALQRSHCNITCHIEVTDRRKQGSEVTDGGGLTIRTFQTVTEPKLGLATMYANKNGVCNLVGLGGIVSNVRNAIQAHNTLSNEERPDNVRAASLLARIRADDLEALGHLFVEYGEPLYRLAYRVLGSASDAEDVVQDVFAALPTTLLQYKECGSAIGWLRRVTVRASLTRRRAGRRADDLTARYGREVAVTYETNQTASHLEPFPLQVALEEALRSLPNTLSIVFLLRETEGYSHREIAVALGISEANSKVRLNRAAKKLQYLLRDWL